jgi:hypothetical protein
VGQPVSRSRQIQSGVHLKLLLVNASAVNSMPVVKRTDGVEENPGFYIVAVDKLVY